MLHFEKISGDNWQKHRKAILHSELQFPSKIRTCQKEYMAIVSDKSAIAVAAYDGDEYVGNAVGYGLTKQDLHDHPGLEDLQNPEMTAYIFNIVVEKKFRGSGHGKEIFNYFCKQARDMGFKALVGHFRDNGSAAIMRKLGAKEMACFDNWEGTREKYLLFWLKL